MQTRKIILATDLSANSAFAAKWAYNYAQFAKVEVVLINVIELSVPNWLRDKYNVVENQKKRAEMEAKLVDWYEHHTGGKPDHVLIKVGNVQDVLPEQVAELDASLLVLARSGKSALTKFLAGSTAQMLAANPPCTVAIVHPDHTDIGADSKLVVATDLTESAEKALGVSAVMANVLGTRLDIVHADGVSASVELDEIGIQQDAQLQSKAQAQMDKVLARHQDRLERVDYDTHILDDHPVKALEKFVDDHDVDIVFVGNAASYNIITNIFRRVSVRLTQVLSCTVVIVPPQTDVFSGDTSEEE